MKAQFKYSLRAHLMPRAAFMAVVLVMNLVFGILGNYNVYGQAGKITAVTLCSIALFGIFIMCVITDFELLKGICTAPAGYSTILAPVDSWKIILPRVITILVEDMICFVIGISGVVVQSFILAGLPWEMFYSETSGRPPFLWLSLVTVLGYVYVILLVMFCIALSKSLFYSIKAGTLLAVITTVAVAYAFSLLDFILAPFGAVESYSIFYSVQLLLGPNPGTIVYLLLSLCKSVALFIAASYLMERKINL